MKVDATAATDTSLGFADVYRVHHAFVWQTLRCLGVVDSALDDAVQDVFVVVHRRLPEFEGRAAIKTWLFEIVRRVAWRYRTRAHRDAARTFELPELRSAEDLDDAVDRALAVELLRAFADTLDEDRLRVFVLSEFGQMRGREIAEALGVNLNTVYARLKSAHRQLDRLTTRLRAKESATMVASMRRDRPTRAARRRTWALLAVKLGLPGAATAGAASTAASIGGNAVGLKWLAVLGGVAAAGVAAAVAVRSPEPEPAPQPAAEVAPALVSSPKAEPKREGMGTPANAASVEAPTVDLVEAPAQPLAIEKSGPAPPVKRSAGAAPAAVGDDKAALEAEVARVAAIRDAVRAGRSIDAGVRAYRAEYPDGVLRPEVEALVVEHGCRMASEPSVRAQARAKADEYARRWPSSALVDRLAAVCAEKE